MESPKMTPITTSGKRGDYCKGHFSGSFTGSGRLRIRTSILGLRVQDVGFRALRCRIWGSGTTVRVYSTSRIWG